MDKQLKVLLVEDSEDDALLLLHELGRGGYEPVYERVETAGDMKAAITGKPWDIIISDYRMPCFSAPAALQVLKESGLDLPFIIVSGKIGEDTLVEAMKAGAHDYLIKGNLSRLIPAVERELRESAERSIRRRAVQAIRKGKMEWEAAFDAVSDLILLTDLEGRVIRCNRRLIDYFRTSYREVLGKNIAEVFYGTSQPELNHFQQQNCKKGESEEDIYIPFLSGWFNIARFPMHPSESDQDGYVHIIKDVSSRKRMEEEKRITDRELLTLYAVAFRLNSRRGSTRIMVDLLYQLHHILQIDFSAIYLMERGTLKLSASLGLSSRFTAACSRLHKDAVWVQQVLDGRTFRAGTPADLLSPEVCEAACDMEMGAWCALPLKIGSRSIGLLMVAHKSAKDYTDREVFLLNSIANQIAVLIENHTLYDRMKEKNEELLKSRKALKVNLEEVKRANIELGRLNQAKNSFIGMASHEMKTPLTSIIGGLQFLLHYSGLEMTEEQEEIMSSVYEGVTQLKGLVDDMLSISRIEAQGLVVRKSLVAVMALCREVHETFDLPLSAREITVDIGYDDLRVPVDESLFKTVFRNLLENAIKFTPDGGMITVSGTVIPRADIITRAGELRPFYPDFPHNLSQSGTFFRLDVADTGIGIPDGEMVRVFEKFHSVGDIAYHSSGKTDFMSKGSGLGLSIVKGIMDGHDGMVWVGPGDGGRGCVFSLLFPMEQ